MGLLNPILINPALSPLVILTGAETLFCCMTTLSAEVDPFFLPKLQILQELRVVYTIIK